MTHIPSRYHASPPEPTPAQRRQITVLFCDLAGFTGLSEQLDPECLHQVLSHYHGLCARTITRHGGQVRQYLGDGVLAYFGQEPAASQAQAARRAVAAGLAITGAIGGLERRFQPLGVALTVRVGIHSGTVVLGSTGGGGHREILAVGQVPNIAARLQALAGDNQVVVTETVRTLVGERFQDDPLGIRRLKGFSRPLAVYRLQRRLRQSRPGHWPSYPPLAQPPASTLIAGTIHWERWRRLPAAIGPPTPGAF